MRPERFRSYLGVSAVPLGEDAAVGKRPSEHLNDELTEIIRFMNYPTSTKQSCFVCYYRVSTTQQGKSGLGLEAQREIVEQYVASHSGSVLGEFTEMESGRRANRLQLTAALALCRRSKAVLLIAKLDRLARNVHFISGLMDSGVEFVAADAPAKDRFLLHIQAAFAEEEARRISLRTKEALAAAKRRGVVIGGTGRLLAQRHKIEAQQRANSYRTAFGEVARSGATTTRQFRDALNAKGIPGPGGGRWHLPNTFRTLKRLSGEDHLGAAASPQTSTVPDFNRTQSFPKMLSL